MGAKDIKSMFKAAGETSPGAALQSVLESADVHALAAVLAGEHPQTVATVLAHLPPARGAELLKRIDEPARSELIIRVARLGPIGPGTLDDLATALAHRLAGRASHRNDLGGASKVAALLGAMGRETSEALLDGLAETDADLAEQVRSEMFRFTDLAKLDGRGMQTLLKHVPNGTLRMALKAAPEAVSDLIYANVSARAATTLKDDVAALPKTRRTDVEAAQREIVQLALTLIERGELALPDPSERYV